MHMDFCKAMQSCVKPVSTCKMSICMPIYLMLPLNYTVFSQCIYGDIGISASGAHITIIGAASSPDCSCVILAVQHASVAPNSSR